MSRQLISRSPDLRRLQKEGYEVKVVSDHLVITHVPYVNSECKIRFGTLVSTLTLAGEKTARPNTHVAFFVGDQPCHKDGNEIQQIKHNQAKQVLGEGLEVDRAFSNKPSGGYSDYYEKMRTYIKIISSPAEALDPAATARTFMMVGGDDEQSVFKYSDTASTRAGIGALSTRLAGHKIAIVGLGGTGSYILDLVAKTPVAEIHLFDGDDFLQHNAFRSPGAPSLDELRARPKKVQRLASIYSKMHNGLSLHAVYLDDKNAEVLAKMDFAFLCLDSGPARRVIIDVLHKHNKPYIDVGMGVEALLDEQTLLGTVRVSISSPDHRAGEKHIPTGDGDPDAEYNSNIQIADLNCLNAALAVIRWKRWLGFYQDLEKEHYAVYTTNVNQLLSEERDESQTPSS